MLFRCISHTKLLSLDIRITVSRSVVSSTPCTIYVTMLYYRRVGSLVNGSGCFMSRSTHIGHKIVDGDANLAESLWVHQRQLRHRGRVGHLLRGGGGGLPARVQRG